MPRGGNNRKPVNLHLVEGTYRKDRHAGALAVEQRIQAKSRQRYTTADPPCSFCGAIGYPIYADQKLTAFICPECVFLAVELHEKEAENGPQTAPIGGNDG